LTEIATFFKEKNDIGVIVWNWIFENLKEKKNCSKREKNFSIHIGRQIAEKI
jgi:hypothetical protein